MLRGVALVLQLTLRAAEARGRLSALFHAAEESFSSHFRPPWRIGGDQGVVFDAFHAIDVGSATAFPLRLVVEPNNLEHARAGIEGDWQNVVTSTIVNRTLRLSWHTTPPLLQDRPVVVRVPHGALRSLALGDKFTGAAVLLRSAPAPAFEVSAGGAGGVVLADYPVRDDPPDPSYSLKLTVAATATHPLLLCSSDTQRLDFVQVESSSPKHVRVENFTARSAVVRGYGAGDVYVFPGWGSPFREARVQHYGSGLLELDSWSSDVSLTGTGDTWISSVNVVTGRLNGGGSLFVDGGTSTGVRVIKGSRGKVVLTDDDPPDPLVDCPEPAVLGFTGF